MALILVATVAMVVFFGVRHGLRPLNRLEAAIQQRSLTDLRPIERQIPVEARGIVQRLNDLFARLSQAQTARERLISNAAHQLRNPVAAIHTMAQAVEAAATPEDARTRATELVQETRRTKRLTQQLLSFERIQGVTPALQDTDLTALVQDLAAQIGPRVLQADVAFEVDVPDTPLPARADAALLREALTNLVENALQHAGPSLSNIAIHVYGTDGMAQIAVQNDGAAITHPDPDQLFDRFAQGGESDGAGLGLWLRDRRAGLCHLRTAAGV